MNDRSQFVQKGYRYLWIIGGAFEADIGEQTENMICYQKAPSTRGYHYSHVPIVIQP